MSMLTTIEGVYKDGQIRLSEKPAGIQTAEVVVTFLDEPDAPNEPAEMMRLGMFAGPKVTNEEDFKLAEWRGEQELDDE